MYNSNAINSSSIRNTSSTSLPASSPSPSVQLLNFLVKINNDTLVAPVKRLGQRLAHLFPPGGKKEIWYDALAEPDPLANKPSTPEDERWFDALGTQPDPPVPFREDFKILLRQLISRFGIVKESELLLGELSRYFPGLPVELLVTAQSVYNACKNGRDIDLALLDSLAMASGWLLADGNYLSRTAHSVRQSLIDYLGDDAQEQGHYTVFTALAVLAIVARYYWRDDARMPDRAILQWPLFLQTLWLRANRYWGQLGRMAQHANATCMMWAGRDRYQCVSDEALRQRTGRELWTCNEASPTQKPQAQCAVNLSGEAFTQMKTDGYLRMRLTDPDPTDSAPLAEEPIPLSAAGATHSLRETAPLMLPLTIAAVQVHSSVRGNARVAGAVSATLLASAAGVAMYHLRANSKPAPEQASNTPAPSPDGRITCAEKELLKKLITSLFPAGNTPIPAEIPLHPPLTSGERSALEKVVTEIKASLHITPTTGLIRTRRETSQVDERTLYWRAKLAQTPAGSAEREPLTKLAKMNDKPLTSRAVPKESVPHQDTWYTGMDRFDQSAFKDFWFFGNIKQLAQDIARSNIADYPDGTLPRDKWMHGDLFWQALYLQIVEKWGEKILESDTAMASDYRSALKQVGSHLLLLKTFGRSTVSLPQFSPAGFPLLQATVESLQHAQGKLEEFSQQEQQRLTETLQDKVWRVKQTQSQQRNDTLGYIGIVDHLERIDLSALSPGFIPELVQLVNSVAQLQLSTLNTTQRFDQTRFYSELSLLSLKRLLDALRTADAKKAWHYAALEEQVTGTLTETFEQGKKHHLLEKYHKIYLPYREEAWKAYQKMQDRVPALSASTEALPTVSVAAAEPTAPELPALFSRQTWSQVTNYIDRHGNVTLPETRQDINDVIDAEITKQAGEFMARFVAFTHADIMNPARYLDRWVTNTLRQNGLQRRLSPSSTLSVTFHDHEFKTGTTSDSREKPFALREIVRGLHLQKDHDSYKVNWPEYVTPQMQETLRNSIDSDIRRDIDNHFVEKELVPLYRVMARRAGLAYLERKNLLLGTDRALRDKQQNAFIDGVSGFLTGKVKPQLLTWQKEQVPGVIFIPAASSDGKRVRSGVLLSLWDHDYHDIPGPGLGETLLSSAFFKAHPTAKKIPPLVVERDKRLWAFIKRHNVPRTAEAASEVDDPFNYNVVTLHKSGYVGNTQGNDWVYYAPFDLVNTDNFILSHIALQKTDLLTTYDNFIATSSEHTRALAYEMCNSLAMSAGAMLMLAGGLPGIPLAAAVGASLAATLSLEIVPNVALYMLADDDEERQLYLNTIIFAAAAETLGTLPLGVKLTRTAAVKRLFEGISHTLPALVVATENMVSQVVRHLPVEWLRPLAEQIPVISKATQDELHDIVKHSSFSSGRAAQNDARPYITSSSRHLWRTAGSQPSTSTAPAAHRFFTSEDVIWHGLHRKLWNKSYSLIYRVILRWDKAKANTVNIEYLTLARKGDDVVVITRLREGFRNAFLFSSETEWAWSVRAAAAKGNTLVKYIDFTRRGDFTAKHGNLAALSATLEKDKYIEGAITLFAPEDYRSAIKARTGLDYDDIQRALRQPQRLNKLKIPAEIFPLKGIQSDIITEPVRALPGESVKTVAMTTDFDAAGWLAEFRKHNNLLAKDFTQSGAQWLAPLQAFITEKALTDVRFRCVLIWKNELSQPQINYLVIATHANIDYAFDLAFAHFNKRIKSLAGPLIIPEADWAIIYGKPGGSELIKYKDVAATSVPEEMLATASLLPGDVIEGATILTMPQWFLTLKRAMVERMVELPPLPLPLSHRLKHHILQGRKSASGLCVLDFTLLDEPRLNNFLVMQRVDDVTNLGPDIKAFHPLPDLSYTRDALKILTPFYTRAITSSRSFEVLGKNLPVLLSNKNQAFRDLIALERFKKAFSSAYELMGKVKHLLELAANDINVRVTILGRLALFLNDKNPHVLAESYKRLEFAAEETLKILYFHVQTKKWTRIIPVKATEGEGRKFTMAFTYPGDPMKRIMVVINNCRHFDMMGAALHETTHLAFGSLDAHYLNIRPDNHIRDYRIATPEKAHRIYGTNIPDESALKFGMGRIEGVNNDLYNLRLSQTEEMVSIARLMKLPMLKANLKMNNADSLVVLFNDLIENIKIPADALPLSENMGTRVRREAASEDTEQIIDKLLKEEIVATILLQVGQSGNSTLWMDDDVDSPGD